MKIDKSKLSKALKQIGIFVGRGSINQNASLVHFRNENKKAVVFASDFASAGRATFDTDEDSLFEFCIEYTQLLQATKVRSKEINAELFTDREDANGVKSTGIEFSDEKTKLTWSVRPVDSLAEIESKTAIPDSSCVEIDAKTLKGALKEAGYARDEKNTQFPFVIGVNFVSDNGVVSLVSTDKKRVACWKQQQESIPVNDSTVVSGIFSPKTIQSVMLFDDDENVKVYLEETQIALVSDTFEAYATKIQADFPNVQEMFKQEIVSSYQVSVSDVKESLGIIDGVSAKSLKLVFTQDNIHIVATLDTGESVDDEIVCIRKSGGDETIYLNPAFFGQIFSNVNADKMTLEFRNANAKLKIISYSTEDGAYGMLAPQKAAAN